LNVSFILIQYNLWGILDQRGRWKLVRDTKCCTSIPLRMC